MLRWTRRRSITADTLIDELDCIAAQRSHPKVDRSDNGGPELAFPKPDAWSTYLRRALLRLTDADAALLAKKLQPMLSAPKATVGTYPATG